MEEKDKLRNTYSSYGVARSGMAERTSIELEKV